MFPFKKKKTEGNTEIHSDNVAKKSIKTMDTVVTGMILGGIIASLYGVKKLREKNNKWEDNKEHSHK
jgi:hypothetical protein